MNIQDPRRTAGLEFRSASPFSLEYIRLTLQT
jgi:hypothetical protein